LQIEKHQCEVNLLRKNASFKTQVDNNRNMKQEMELISCQNQALAQRVKQKIIRNRNNGARGKGKCSTVSDSWKRRGACQVKKRKSQSVRKRENFV